jgi:hypothetical protein
MFRNDARSYRGQTDWLRSEDRTMAKKAKRVKCEDCFFHQNQLCALDRDEPCPTFRAAERGLVPEKQLSFAFRTERTWAAYAFPQPG